MAEAAQKALGSLKGLVWGSSTAAPEAKPAGKEVAVPKVETCEAGFPWTTTGLLSVAASLGFFLGMEESKRRRGRSIIGSLAGYWRPDVSGITGPVVLHVYDHCPFCIRVELALAWLGIPYERKIYGYGDIEGPVKLHGKKALPVLEWPAKTYTPESLDIVDLLDSQTAHRSIAPTTQREDIQNWLKRLTPIRRLLSRPRIIQMPIPDWEKKSDVEYARQKYEKQDFDYISAEAQTSELLKKVNPMMEEFAVNILYDEHSVNEFGFGLDDILVLPDLRTMTCVKGIKWPPKLKNYIKNSFCSTIAQPYFDCAI